MSHETESLMMLWKKIVFILARYDIPQIKKLLKWSLKA